MPVLPSRERTSPITLVMYFTYINKTGVIMKIPLISPNQYQIRTVSHMHAPTLDIKTQRAVLSVGILAQPERQGEAGLGLHNGHSEVKIQKLRPPQVHTGTKVPKPTSRFQST